MKTFATTRPVTRPAESGSPAKPVRVLIVAPSLDILGGQAIQATRLIEGFREEPSLKVGFLPHNPRLKGIFRVAQSIKYVRTLVTSSLYFVLLLINVPRYDVIHIFSASYYSYLLCAMPAIIVARLFGRPSILNYRSGEAEDHLTRWPATAVPTMRLADKIVVPSGYLVDTFRRFGLGAESISNAVDTEVFSYHPRNPLRPVFLSGRNLEPLYNVACVLRAFDLIQRRFPGARLIIAGDGSCRESLEKLASELRLKNTEFIGAVEPDRMNVLYDSADIYLNSSNIDNMPASILEAFACGLPVVTTNAGGIPYIVSHEETGLMVECDDFMAMAASAIRLLEDQPFATRLAKNALNECAKYTWSRIRDLWVNLYAQMSVDAHIKANRQAEPNIDGFEEAREPRTRILIVAPSMNILGGQSIQAGHLHSMLKGAPNLSVRLLPINPTLPSPFNLLQRIKYLRTLATSSFFCYSLIRHLRRYDIVHVFSASYFSFVLSPTPAMLVARLYRKKIVLNYHSGEAEDHLKTWRRTAVRTMRLADRIVVPSAFLVDVFNEFSLPATAIFNTVDTDVFAFRERLPLRPVFLSNRNL
ncbi:MAG TPA: glycosyltransferase, partial [Blastocatellia bacterium]